MLAGEVFNLKHGLTCKSLFNGYTFVFSGCAIFILSVITGKEIEISKALYYGGLGFYPLTILGIWFCVSFANSVKEKRIGCFLLCVANIVFILWLFILCFLSL